MRTFLPTNHVAFIGQNARCGKNKRWDILRLVKVRPEKFAPEKFAITPSLSPASHRL
jgi:hypothetical protein